MPQVFQVLRCYKCLVFQVHLTKKSFKFECKMCGEKQSVKRHYGVGNAQECRLHVQKLNIVRGEVDMLKPLNNESSDSEVENSVKQINIKNKPRTNSRWSAFIDNKTATNDIKEDSDETLQGVEVVLEIPKKRKKYLNKKNYKGWNNNKKTKEQPDNEIISLDNQTNSCDQIYNFKNQVIQNKSKDNLSFSSSRQTLSAISQTSNDQRCNIYCTNKNILNLKKHIPVSSKLKKKFEPPTINKNSKWAEFAGVKENNIQDNGIFYLDHGGIEIDSTAILNLSEIETKPSKFSSSKSEINEEASKIKLMKSSSKNNTVIPEQTTKSNVHTLFSLCNDEGELDKYLDF